MQKYGVSGNELAWFTSYLQDRRQLCKVNGVSSRIEEIHCGVPQGSCLGPLLFIVYINDLPFCLESCQVTMYADDTSISFTAKSVNDLNMTLNKDLDSLRKWLQGNKLSLNILKTLAMVIGSHPNFKKISTKLVETPSFTIRGSDIEMVGNVKYLGVQIDRHLPWDEHIHFVRSKVSRARSYCHRTLSVKCIVVSLNRTSATAVQSGRQMGGLGCRCCKNFKTMPLEL